jgi:hypothetical protein
LHVDIAGSHRKRHGAEFFAGHLEADPGGPDPVPHRDLNPVRRIHPGHFIGPGEKPDPVLHVFPGIAEIFPFSRGAAGRMDAHHFFKRDRA